MPGLPAFVLKKLYVKGSLKNTDGGFALSIRNTLAPGTITGVAPLQVDGQSYPLEKTSLQVGETSLPAGEVSATASYQFPLNATATIQVAGETLAPGAHQIVITVTTQEVGELKIEVSDTL
ncbi:MAG: hydroxymethylglutaryl-CoA reductase [Deltaproteobacteria bacterium]|nr:MAG: hydroxymethylglutaryl-CoA reductase [Deltaproteobacteria bacterium]